MAGPCQGAVGGGGLCQACPPAPGALVLTSGIHDLLKRCSGLCLYLHVALCICVCVQMLPSQENTNIAGLGGILAISL